MRAPNVFRPCMTNDVKLLARMRTVLRIRHYSRSTEAAYTGWVRRYVTFHGLRHPATMGAPEVAAFLAHLAEQRHVSAATQTQALAALLFLYRRVLERESGWVEGLRAKAPVRLPVVLSREHVRAVLATLVGEKRLAAQLLYGSGLRLTSDDAAGARGGGIAGAARAGGGAARARPGGRCARVATRCVRAEEPHGGAGIPVAVALSGVAGVRRPRGDAMAAAPASECAATRGGLGVRSPLDRTGGKPCLS
jgi:hypothetical protein